jgi:hypothetical protein
MSIFRVNKTKDFVTINNTALRDKRLSWGARGILAYLLTKPDDWDVRSSDLVEQGTQKREAVLKMLRELETYGYLQRQRTKNPQTGRYEWETHVYEVPQSEKPTEEARIFKKPNKSPKSVLPTQESPTQVSPTQENPTVKEELKEEELNKEIPSGAKSAPLAVEVSQVFEHWKSTLQRTRAKLTPERSKAIRARLGDGYSVEGKPTNEDKLRTILERRTQAATGEYHSGDETGDQLVRTGGFRATSDDRSLALAFK